MTIPENWALGSILRFREHLKTRQQSGEVTAGTIKNYYRSIKLLCEMNDEGYTVDQLAYFLEDYANPSEVARITEFNERRRKFLSTGRLSLPNQVRRNNHRLYWRIIVFVRLD